MNKLLRANLFRLKRNMVFWLSAAAMAALAVFALLDYSRHGRDTIADNYYFGFAMAIGIPIATFCSMFLGTEYSDGAIRNKLCVGHTRCAIYLANWIVGFMAALLVSLAFLIPAAAVSIPLFGAPRLPLSAFCLLLLTAAAMIAALVSVYTALGMLISSRSLGAVVSLLSIFAWMLFSVFVYSRLQEPEFYEALIYQGTDGSSALESMANPLFLQGAARAVFEFLNDFLPCGQGLQLARGTVQLPWLLIAYSLLIAAAATGAGLYFFDKKDLK